MSKPRILIADDHAILRAGLRSLLAVQGEFDVVDEASSAEEVVEKAGALRPDIVLLDVTMPGGPFDQTMRRIRDASPASRVIILTMHDDPAYQRRAEQMGAAAFVVKQADSSALVAALRSVAAQGPAHAHAPLKATSGPKPRTDSADALAMLSLREREVLALLARGHTNAEVARLVYLSVKTVETYRSRIAEKLGLKSRAEMTAFAREHGLFDRDLP